MSKLIFKLALIVLAQSINQTVINRRWQEQIQMHCTFILIINTPSHLRILAHTHTHIHTQSHNLCISCYVLARVCFFDIAFHSNLVQFVCVFLRVCHYVSVWMSVFAGFENFIKTKPVLMFSKTILMLWDKTLPVLGLFKGS